MSSLTVSKEPPVSDLFYECHKPEVMKALDPFLTRDPANIIATYVVGKENPFGAADWKKYFGIDIPDAPKLPPSFYAWWFGRDSIEPSKQRFETHFPPVLRPDGMSIRKLGVTVQNPKVGHPTKIDDWPKIFNENESQAGPTCYVVLRKDVFAKGQTYDVQRSFINRLNLTTSVGYEVEPSVIDLVTAIFIRYVCTGERYLAYNGEGFGTYTRAVDPGKNSNDNGRLVFIGAYKQTASLFGHYIGGGSREDTAISCLRKF